MILCRLQILVFTSQMNHTKLRIIIRIPLAYCPLGSVALRVAMVEEGRFEDRCLTCERGVGGGEEVGAGGPSRALSAVNALPPPLLGFSVPTASSTS